MARRQRAICVVVRDERVTVYIPNEKAAIGRHDVQQFVDGGYKLVSTREVLHDRVVDDDGNVGVAKCTLEFVGWTEMQQCPRERVPVFDLTLKGSRNICSHKAGGAVRDTEGHLASPISYLKARTRRDLRHRIVEPVVHLGQINGPPTSQRSVSASTRGKGAKVGVENTVFAL